MKHVCPNEVNHSCKPVYSVHNKHNTQVNIFVPMRSITAARAMSAMALASTIVLATFVIPVPTYANPPTAPSGQLAFKFNYIAAPDIKNGNFDCGNGHRIFTLLGERSQHINWTFDPTQPININDCLTEAMDGTPAHVFANAQNTYTIWVRILGPNIATNSLNICRATTTDFSLCELGFVNLSRTGTDSFSFPIKLFDDTLVNEFWQLNQTSGFRIAEVRLYA